MILKCSAGHSFDTKDIGHLVAWGQNRLVAGGKCPMLMSYDRIGGSSYCGRILKEVKNADVRKP